MASVSRHHGRIRPRCVGEHGGRRLRVRVHLANPTIRIIHGPAPEVHGRALALHRWAGTVVRIVAASSRVSRKRHLDGCALGRTRRQWLWKILRSWTRPFAALSEHVQPIFRVTHISVRGSFRILNFTPWSAKERDRNVDSAIPGKFFGGDTMSVSTARAASRGGGFSPVKRSETIVFKLVATSLRASVWPSGCLCLSLGEAYFRISYKLN